MLKVSTWQNLPKTQRQAAIKRLVRGGWPPEVDFTDLVIAREHWGVFASTGPHFMDAIFGRDAIETAEDLLHSHPDLVRDIILSLARLQGVKTDLTSEEEPGKILHEYRTAHFDGQQVPAHSIEILHHLQKQWGGSGTDQMIYYGSQDASLLFVRLINRYVKAFGREILSTTITGRDSQSKSVADSALAATYWAVGKIESSSTQLFTYKRLNIAGLGNQTWKDSSTSFLRADGGLPDFSKGLAPLQLQGYAYDALLAAVSLELSDETERQHWRELAKGLQKQTINKLWMEDKQFFAQGIDFDDNDQPRQLDSLTSDAGVLLETGLLKELPSEQAKPFIEGIVRLICGPDFLTGAGVRCRSLDHWHLPGFIDYHGSNTVWPKETFDVAKGLRNFGFHRLASALEECLVYALESAGEFYEFFYVSRDGIIWYDREAALKHFGGESPGHRLPNPESGQAWTIAAAERIAYNHFRHPKVDQQASELEQELMERIPLLTAS